MNLDVLRSYEVRSRDHDYTARDTILYALGLGYGSNPVDEAEVSFVYENGLRALPSMCNTLAHPGFWINDPALEIDWVSVLHAEQSFVVHAPLAPAGAVHATYRIASVEDKGADKGAILAIEKLLTDRASQRLLCTVTQTIFLRGDGGQGGFGTIAPPPGALPAGPPDRVVDLPTLPQLALIYRLSGDLNPLHASPAVARRAGFDRPILHGLCTMGLATRALLEAACDRDPSRLTSLYVRFSKPVFPGETIRTELYHQGATVRFRCCSVERDVVVLDRGMATIAAAGGSAA